MSAFVKDGKPAAKKFAPQGRNIAYQMLSNSEGHTSEGGIHMPEAIVWRNPIGVAIACGPDVQQVREGDRILLNPALNYEIVRYDGDEYQLVNEERLSGVIPQPRTDDRAE